MISDYHKKLSTLLADLELELTHGQVSHKLASTISSLDELFSSFESSNSIVCDDDSCHILVKRCLHSLGLIYRLCQIHTNLSEVSDIFQECHTLQSHLVSLLSREQTHFEQTGSIKSVIDLIETVFDVANISAALDVRISLPLWKFGSSLIQQHIIEIRQLLKSEQIANLLDKIMGPILDSSSYFLSKCVEQSESVQCSPNTDMKMLNLLCRIGTYMIKECAHTAMTSDSSNLTRWLAWLIDTRYAGGLHPSGYNFPPDLVRHLDTSLYLSVDVQLGHLASLRQSTTGKQQTSSCSVSATYLGRQVFEPAVRLRIYGLILTNFVQHPEYYERWINEDFNLYMEVMDGCMTLDLPTICQNASDAAALFGEFYTTILEQLCASVCGLPPNCFYYLENALLRGLFTDHVWTRLLAMDIWCFVARYGTGDLCWQYITTLATAIERSTGRSPSNYQQEQQCTMNAAALTSIGQLLTRLIIFLTPKQQVRFLQQYPLDGPNWMTMAQSEFSPSIWQVICLPFNRLQKSAQTAATESLTRRVVSLLDFIDTHPVESKQNLQIIVELITTLRLVDAQNDEWRKMHHTLVNKLVNIFAYHRAHWTTVIGIPPHAPHVKLALKQPVYLLCNHLAQWTCGSDDKTTNHNPGKMVLYKLFEWFVLVSAKVYAPNPVNRPIVSFLCLRTFYNWLCSFCLIITNGHVRSLKLLSDMVNHYSDAHLSPFCLPLVRELKTKLTAALTSPMDCQSPTSGSVELIIHELTSGVDKLEVLHNASAFPWPQYAVQTIRSLADRLHQLTCLPNSV